MTTFPTRLPLHDYPWSTNSGAVNALAFFPDGNHVVTAGHDDYSTRIWELQTGNEEHLSGYHTGPTLCVAISNNGKEIVTGGSDGRVVLWNAETRTVSKTLYAAAGSPRSESKILCVAFNNTAPALVASSGSDGVVRFWKLGADEYSNPSKQLVIPNKPTVSSIAFSPGSPGVNCIAVASFDKKIRIYDVYSGRSETPLAMFDAHAIFVTSLAWFPAGQQLVAAGEKTVHIWDTRIRNQEVFPRTLAGHSKLVKSVAVSPDGRFIASGSDDGTVRLWNGVTGVQIGPSLSIAHATAGVEIVAFSPNGKKVLSITKNGGYLWDLDYLEVEEGVDDLRRGVDDLFTSSAEQQRQMREVFEREMNELRLTHEQDLADLREELEQARIAEDGRFNALQNAHQSAIDRQEEEFRTSQNDLHNAMRRQESQFNEERTSWGARFNAMHSDLQGLIKTQADRLNSLEDVGRTHERGLKELLSVQEKAEETQEQRHKSLKKGLQELVAQLKKSHDNNPPAPTRPGSNVN